MAKRLNTNTSKNSISFEIIDDYTDPVTKKRSTYPYESLGNLNYLMEKYNVSSYDEVKAILDDYVLELRKRDKEENGTVTIELSQSKLIPRDKTRNFSLGYLYPRNILNSLGINKICQSISEKYKFKYSLYHIICDLVSARIIDPASKLATYEKTTKKFFDQPDYSLENIYRSLNIMADERYYIESELYKNSDKLFKRNTTVLYYDCTNFYFEIEEDDDFRKYGKSKENRPNPIVQYGLFIDSDGIPIADIVFEGNKNEQFSMRELEKEIEKTFGFHKFIVCADAGLNGWENKVYNDRKRNGAYIVTKPVRTMTKKNKEWTIEINGWKILGHPGTYDISKLKDTINIDGKEINTDDITFYKEKWIKETKKTELTGEKYTLEEHLIVTYSTKFKKYLRRKREEKLKRARRLLKNPGNINTTDQRNPRYYIKTTKTTKTGEIADESYYCIDMEKVAEDEKYDGFYAVTTDLEDKDIGVIINANKQRWEIEESFEIMKSELGTRPMYVSSEDSIKGHLLICFIALLVYRILEKKYLKEKYTCPQIMDTLRNMETTYLYGPYYVPAFDRTEIIDELADIFGFQPSREVLTQKYLRKFIKVVNSKKSTKLKQQK